jgi:putative oxidoreductase
MMANALQGFVTLLARLMLAAIFLVSAVGNKIPHFQATCDYMQAEGVPQPRLALFGAIALLLLGGLSVIPGAWTRIGAMFFFTFLVAATYFFHDFWSFGDPGQRQLQWIQFMKNLAIGGGLLMLAVFGPGPWSVDGWIAMKQDEVEGGGRTARPKPPSTGSQPKKAA